MITENRPWGAFHVLEQGDGYKVKRIEVNPGGRLSLQSHKHRGEHWTVIRGVATVTVNERVFELKWAEATLIPLGAKHRLENLTSEPLAIIEVQLGDYLEEDDIIRYDDVYKRD